jgi:hypothetical protein
MKERKTGFKGRIKGVSAQIGNKGLVAGVFPNKSKRKSLYHQRRGKKERTIKMNPATSSAAYLLSICYYTENLVSWA